MRWLRKFLGNTHGDAEAITTVIGFLIVLGISVLIFYNIMASVDVTDLDSGFTGTPAANATGEVLDQAETFYQIAPILAIVIIAVIIIAYVKKV